MMKNVILANNQTSIVLFLKLVSQLIKNYGIFKAYLVSSLQNKYLFIYKDTFEVIAHLKYEKYWKEHVQFSSKLFGKRNFLIQTRKFIHIAPLLCR